MTEAQPRSDTTDDGRPIRRLQFYGRNRSPFSDRSSEVLLSGPAGTGKTMALLTKLFLAAEKYPRMRGLICRKTRASLTEAALVTWEEKILPEGHSALIGPTRGHRTTYQFPNGSVIVVGGMDKAQKIMSTEYDLIYVQEAIELTEHDWESLTTRLRNNVMPYQQIFADTNPDRPTHWLKKRCDVGRTRIYDTRHEDNPGIFDQRTGRLTSTGEDYLKKLEALSGPRKLRLRHGRWVQSDGVVYDGWDPAVHVIDPFEIPKDWKRLYSIDFGFTNPFACLWLAEDPDGRLYLYREIYKTRTMVRDHAREILWLSGAWNPQTMRADWDQPRAEPRPWRIISDHDSGDRATIEDALGIETEPADKAVSPGIQAVALRLRPDTDNDGRPRLFVFSASLVKPDPLLVDAKKPTRLAEEFDGYVWNPSGKDEPLKNDDHALDALRYAVVATDGRPELLGPDAVRVGPPVVAATAQGRNVEPVPQQRIYADADDSGESVFERMPS